MCFKVSYSRFLQLLYNEGNIPVALSRKALPCRISHWRGIWGMLRMIRLYHRLSTSIFIDCFHCAGVVQPRTVNFGLWAWWSNRTRRRISMWFLHCHSSWVWALIHLQSQVAVSNRFSKSSHTMLLKVAPLRKPFPRGFSKSSKTI